MLKNVFGLLSFVAVFLASGHADAQPPQSTSPPGATKPTLNAGVDTAPAVDPKVLPRPVLVPFNYQGVTLEPGALKRQVDEVKAFYLAIPNDELLRGFRKRAGKPDPGKGLSGWYSSDLFHVFGQIVAGLSRLYAATGDPACRDKAQFLVAQWAECIEPDGFFFYSPHPKTPHYTYDKMVGGLVDAHLYAHDPHAMEHLERITQWAVKNLKRDRDCPMIANINAGEWYTLSENLYRAYLASDRRTPIYRDFGRVWEYTDYWSVYARGGSIFDLNCAGKPREYHAYSHVNTLSGAAVAYQITGEQHYLDTIRNAYDFLQKTQCVATGGYGPNERLFPTDVLEATLSQTHNSFETQCGCWAGFKLGKYLITWTGDAQYGDWIERLVYNGVGASIPSNSDGRVYYYADYNLASGTKALFPATWSCCTGTRPCAVADYCDLIYFKSGSDICVNLYTPSTARFQSGETSVVLHQETDFPQTDKIRFTVNVDQPVEFAVKFRSPQWIAGPASGAVNGQPQALTVDKLHWMTVRRAWQNGDRLEIRLPMALAAKRLPDEHARHYAVTVGPVVLAAQGGKNPSQLVDAANLEKSLVATPGKALNYQAAGSPKVIFKPFYDIAAGEKYFMYLADKPVPSAAKTNATAPGSK